MLQCFCSDKDEQNALKSLEKEVILSWKIWKTTVRFMYDACAALFKQMCQGSSGTKPNPENCNCSSKCADDYAQLQKVIQHRTVLIISPLTSRQVS